MPAHRVSWIIHKGAIPEGLVVRHSCDNRSCVNPNHLLLGTYADNARDAMCRGRTGGGAINQIRGEQCKNAKLKAPQVRKILKALLKGASCASLARIYGVAGPTISDINLKKTWKHIEV